MPQIAQLAETYSSQIFWLLVFFGFTFFVIGRGMVPRVMATVSAREAQVSGDLAAAEAARAEAQAVELRWQAALADQRAEAQGLIAKAKAAGASAAEVRLAKAAAAVDARVADAEAQIAKARASALGEIETVAADAAGEIVARLAGLTVDAGATRTAVKEVLHG